MSQESQAAAVARSLEREGYINLGTFRRDGREVRTPVWFAESGGLVYVFTEARAGKVKRIRGRGRVRLAACNVRGTVHGDWQDGQGRVVSDPATEAKGYAALHAKYGWQMRIADFFSRLTGRIEGRAMLEIELTGRASEAEA